MHPHAVLSFPTRHDSSNHLVLNNFPFINEIDTRLNDSIDHWPQHSNRIRRISCDSLASSNDLSLPTSDSEDPRLGEGFSLPNWDKSFNGKDDFLPIEHLSYLIHIDNSTKYNDSHSRINYAKISSKCNLYKTELCRSYEETGHCRYETKCQFAHSIVELRFITRHPKYKTVVCKTFWEQGTCPYGKRCCFIHHARIHNKDNSNTQEDPIDRDNSILRHYTIKSQIENTPQEKSNRFHSDPFTLFSSNPANLDSKRNITRRLPIFRHIG